MDQVHHGSATTTEAFRRAIQHSQASLRAFSKRYGINQKTLRDGRSAARWPICRPGSRSRIPRCCCWNEAIIIAFRRHMLLPLDDCLYALQATIPHLTRSSLHRCLQRRGISLLPQIEGDKPAKKKFKADLIGCFHNDIAEVQRADGKLRPWRSTGPPSSPMPNCMRRRARWSRPNSCAA